MEYKPLTPQQRGSIGGLYAWHKNREGMLENCAKGGEAVLKKYGRGYLKRIALLPRKKRGS